MRIDSLHKLYLQCVYWFTTKTALQMFPSLVVGKKLENPNEVNDQVRLSQM